MNPEFSIFQKEDGKFRVSITELCNLNCFFCHNEGMKNPRQSIDRISNRFSLAELTKIINSYISLGGRQVNITGGEPLLVSELPAFLSQIQKGSSKIVLNTNALHPDILLNNPLQDVLDCLLISLHTTNENSFQRWLGKPKSQILIKNIIALKENGYKIELNCSLGNYNITDFENVLQFCIEEQLPLKVITVIRHNLKEDFYQGDWINPEHLTAILEKYGAKQIKEKNALGGQKKEYEIGGISVTIKNVGNGKLITDYCKDCKYLLQCGEGIYGLRVGVDGIWKPCLLNKEKYESIRSDEDYSDQILQMIGKMVGNWENAKFFQGVPK